MKAVNREKYAIIIYACVLILLFLMSSTDLIIKETPSQIYRVAVIIDDSKDDFYSNYKKGMDQAANDYNIDVSFITLYERNESGQQEDMLVREINDGAQAVVLVPVDPVAMTTVLEEDTSSVPVIILGSELSSNRVRTNITADYFEAGRRTAQAFVREHGPGTPVYLMTEGLKLGSNARFYDGVMNVLEEQNYMVTLVEKTTDYGYEGIIKNMMAPPGNRAAVIALDSGTLTEAARAFSQALEGVETPPLYGPGCNMEIISDTDKGIIKGFTTINWYDAGYLSMQKAVEAIENKSVRETIFLDHFYIQKEDILKKEYEKMLYPIN